MATPFLETLWGPILLAAIAADINFWIYASIGTNEGDAVGIAFFLLFAVYVFARPRTRRQPPIVVSGLGAIAAAVWMSLREKGTLDYGYLPPYILFVAAVLVSHAFLRLRRRTQAKSLHPRS